MCTITYPMFGYRVSLITYKICNGSFMTNTDDSMVTEFP